MTDREAELLTHLGFALLAARGLWAFGMDVDRWITKAIKRVRWMLNRD